MSDDRYRDELGARIDQLERRFQLIDERLSRVESRLGIAAISDVSSPPTDKETELKVTASEISSEARETLPLKEPTKPKAEPPIQPLHVPRVEQVSTKQLWAPRRAERVEKARAPRTYRELEERFTGRALAWIGGLALIVGAIFFLSLAFSRGWIGPTARVTIGLLVGVTLVAAGGWFFERRDRLFGHVLTPVGLGILSLSFFAGTQLYDLFSIEIGLAGALVSSVAAAVIAIRANSQLVAAYGLVTALSAPVVLEASASATTIAFVSVALVGTTVVALYRTWTWLPALAFLLAAPQVIDFVTGDISIAAGMIALGAFWLLNAVAAGGEEFRVNRARLGITSTTLLVANAVFVVGWGFYLLQGDAEWWRGPFLVIVAAAHLALGGYFLATRGDHHPFGMLAFGTGIAAASMALPVQLGGPPVPIGWAAEAAALAWVYTYRRHGYSGLMSVALGSMAIGHLIIFEYPINQVDQDLANRLPFLNANGGTLAFILAALAVATLFVRRWDIGIPVAGLGGVLVIYALPFETSDLLLVGLWAALFVLFVGIDQRLLRPRVASVRPDTDTLRNAALDAVLVVGLTSGVAAGLHVLSYELPSADIGVAALPATPFWDTGTVAAAILIVAMLAAGWLARHHHARRAAALGSFGVAAYLLPFELSPAAVVIGWSVLAVISLALARLDPPAKTMYGLIGEFLMASGSILVLVDVAPVTRLVVSESSTVDHPLFWSGATAAIVSLVLALAFGTWIFRTQRVEKWFWLLVGVGVVYMLSIGVVDDFQRRLGGATSLEELQKQAQVALSILWAVLGGVALVVGLWRQLPVARGAGLALLAVVTAKVFVYDLSSLDAAYRVLSFIGLGVLLLISAYLYQHIGPHGHTPAST